MTNLDRPLVSCVIPVYNTERYVAEAIESALAQTYAPLELVVVDDGSTDRSAEVAASFGARVRAFTQDHASAGAARNRGVVEARGSFLAFLDADDIWAPEKLEYQMARFVARPEIDVSIVAVQNFWVPELAAEAERHRDSYASGPMPGYGGSSMVARRPAFERVGPFLSLSQAEMVDWFGRARDCGLVEEALPDVLVQRRIHADNVTRRTDDDGQSARLTVVKNALNRRRRNTQGA